MQGTGVRGDMAWSKTSRHLRGYGSAWDKLRAFALARDNYLCQEHLRNGRTVAAREVDHIISKAKWIEMHMTNEGVDDESNLQSLCHACHVAKTIREGGGTPRQRIGPDGYPIDEGGMKSPLGVPP